MTLDLSGSSTGWARWTLGRKLPLSGAWHLCDGQAQAASAFVQLHRNLAAIHAEEPIELLVREAPIKLPTDTVDNLTLTYGLAAHAMSYAKVKGIPCEAVTIGKWRETFLGPDRKGVKGKAAFKRLAILRARQLGMDPLTDDEAEAIGILDHVLHKRGIAPPWRIANPFLASLA